MTKGQMASCLALTILACAAIAGYGRKQSQDIAALSAAGNKLRESEQELTAALGRVMLLSSAVEASTDVLQIIDMSGSVMYSNKALMGVYGYAPEELVGRHVGEMNLPARWSMKSGMHLSVALQSPSSTRNDTSADASVPAAGRDRPRPTRVVGKVLRNAFATSEVWLHPNGKVAYLGTIMGGDRVYAIDISNPNATTTAMDLAMTDTLPAGLELVTGDLPHTGQQSAWIGGVDEESYQYLYQQIKLPATAKSLTLRYEGRSVKYTLLNMPRSVVEAIAGEGMAIPKRCILRSTGGRVVGVRASHCCLPTADATPCLIPPSPRGFCIDPRRCPWSGNSSQSHKQC